jgi:hypothetical protein
MKEKEFGEAVSKRVNEHFGEAGSSPLRGVG